MKSVATLAVLLAVGAYARPSESSSNGYKNMPSCAASCLPYKSANECSISNSAFVKCIDKKCPAATKKQALDIAKTIKDKCPAWNPYYNSTLTDEDWMNLRYDLVTLIQQQQVGPVLVRLAWHDAATCNKDTEQGGPHATILVQNKAKQPDPNNAGLDRAIKALAPVYNKYKAGISNADLWSYAGALAISVMGGPVTAWQPGRNDYTCLCQADLDHETNNIPSATDDFTKLTAIFARMGFTPLEMGTLNMGGHSLGRCHKKVSGYHGPWTPYENVFTNGYALLTPLTPKAVENVTLPGGGKSWQSNFMVQKDKYVMALPSDEEIVGNLLGNPGTAAAFLQIHGRNKAGRDQFFAQFQAVWKRLLDCNIDVAKLGGQCVSTYQSDLFGLYDCPLPDNWAQSVSELCPSWEPYYTSTLSDVEWMDLRYELVNLVQQNRVGPVLVRLAWHDAATCNVNSKTGGPHATIIVQNDARQPDPSNDGLERAIDALKPIYAKYEHGISNADLWSYAGAVAVSTMGGPSIRWKPGRNDYDCLCQANLESNTNNIPHPKDDWNKLKATFGRMSFSPTEMGILNLGGHSLGRAHPKFSGYDGPWGPYENVFSNSYAFITPEAKQTNVTVKLPDGGTSWQMNIEALPGKIVMALPSDNTIVENLFGGPDASPTFAQAHARTPESRAFFFTQFQGVFKRLLECNLKPESMGHQCVSTDMSDLFGLYDC
ncbi:hypothetical protein HDU81_009071 [Chytriomyces hyalinus]|nr:hypothetical protein HDU81_009071 [Chytriomyces hyalinus]